MSIADYNKKRGIEGDAKSAGNTGLDERRNRFKSIKS